MINKYVPTHEGNMPIRVLQHNLIYAFENMNQEFLDLVQEVIERTDLDPGIAYMIEEEKLKSPYVLFNKIFIQESFLSYVWCMSFSLVVLYEDAIVKRSRREILGDQEEEPDMMKIQEAYALWAYGVSLIDNYTEWNKELFPNPEYYDERYEDLIPKINGVYLAAMCFILAHEFAHLELEHSKTDIPGMDNNELGIIIEKEADLRALNLVINHKTTINSTGENMGVLVGLCSLLFFKSTTEEKAYPDVDDRIDAVFNFVNPDPMDSMWTIATLAYRLWDNLYGINLEWTEGLDTPKSLYYSIKKQVERS